MDNKSERIKERESWLKLGVIIFFSLVIGVPLFWHLVTGNFQIDLSNLNLESILTLLISFFAILLSVLFYFKTNDTSNQFYNNSYTFTKDISETLRGIEAGFGEKLKNIDKGYEDFRKSFENYMTPTEKGEIKKEVEEEKKKLKEIIEQKDGIISELETKSNLSKQELNKYLKLIKEKEIQLREKNDQIQFIKGQINFNENITVSKNQYYRLRKYLRLKFFPNIDKEILSSGIMTRRHFRKLSDDFNSRFMNDMLDAGFIDSRHELTQKGLDFLRQLSVNE